MKDKIKIGEENLEKYPNIKKQGISIRYYIDAKPEKSALTGNTRHIWQCIYVNGHFKSAVSVDRVRHCHKVDHITNDQHAAMILHIENNEPVICLNKAGSKGKMCSNTKEIEEFYRGIEEFFYEE